VKFLSTDLVDIPADKLINRSLTGWLYTAQIELLNKCTRGYDKISKQASNEEVASRASSL